MCHNQSFPHCKRHPQSTVIHAEQARRTSASFLEKCEALHMPEAAGLKRIDILEPFHTLENIPIVKT